MNMNVINDLLAAAKDKGGLSMDTLMGMKDKLDSGLFDKLKDLIDRNDDGKISLDDLKDFDFSDFLGDIEDSVVGGAVSDAIGGLFGKK